MTEIRYVAVAFLLAILARASPAEAQACPFLPQFETLRASIAHAPPADALPVLYAYFADPANENPAACESFEIERLIGAQERALVTLAIAGRGPIPPDAAYHCDRFDPRTTQCDGLVADDTGHTDGLQPSTQVIGRFAGRIRSALPGARLIGVYRATLGDDFRRRPAPRLSTRPSFAATVRSGDVLIALFAAPAPFKVRKLVWYF